MSRLHDLTGQVFGRLTILKLDCIEKRKTRWIAKCICGNIKSISSSNLISGHIKSCGCLRSESISKRRLKDLTGQVFGRLTVLNIDNQKTISYRIYWLCKCSCGSLTSVLSEHLYLGHTRSCGCLVKELCSQKFTTHGLSKTDTYIKTKNHQYIEKKSLLDSQWTPLMEVCLTNYQPVCVVCGSKNNLSIDHVLPLSKGNGLYPGNAVILCISCNSRKGAKSLNKLPVEVANKIIKAAESFRIAWSGGF